MVSIKPRAREMTAQGKERMWTSHRVSSQCADPENSPVIYVSVRHLRIMIPNGIKIAELG